MTEPLRLLLAATPETNQAAIERLMKTVFTQDKAIVALGALMVFVVLGLMWWENHKLDRRVKHLEEELRKRAETPPVIPDR